MIIIFHEPDSRITSKISLNTLRKMTRAIDEGYLTASNLIRATPFLDSGFAKSRHQDLFNFAIEYFLHEKCTEGTIEMNARNECNVAKNCNHLVLTNDDIMITLSSVRTEGQLPRSAIFRQQKLSNQICMWDDGSDSELKYAIITHKRCQKSDGFFYPAIQIGLPNTNYNGWEDIYNLNDINSIKFTEAEISQNVKNTITLKREFETMVRNL